MTGTPLRVPPLTPLPYSETNRLPALSQARPVVVFNPEAKVLLVPLGVNLKIAPVLRSETNRFCAGALEQIRMTAPKHASLLNVMYRFFILFPFAPLALLLGYTIGLASSLKRRETGSHDLPQFIDRQIWQAPACLAGFVER